MSGTDDPYRQPNGVLRNKLGIAKADALQQTETQRAALREVALRAELPRPPFTFETPKAIHHALFQDVYDWAGEPRQLALGKAAFEGGNSPVTWFAPPNAIESQAAEIFGRLARVGNLAGADRADFANGAADLFIALNDLHPFREGNGRTQRLLLSAVARHAGHDLAFDAVTRQRMVAVSVAASTGDLTAAHRLFDEITNPRRIGALRKGFAFLKANRVAPWNDLYIATTEAGQHYSGALVGVAGNDFMMRVVRRPQDWLAIGDAADLPQGVRSGDAVSIEARHFMSASPRGAPAIARLIDALRPPAGETPTPWSVAAESLAQRVVDYERRRAAQAAAPGKAESGRSEPEPEKGPIAGPRSGPSP